MKLVLQNINTFTLSVFKRILFDLAHWPTPTSSLGKTGETYLIVCDTLKYLTTCKSNIASCMS